MGCVRRTSSGRFINGRIAKSATNEPDKEQAKDGSENILVRKSGAPWTGQRLLSKRGKDGKSVDIFFPDQPLENDNLYNETDDE